MVRGLGFIIYWTGIDTNTQKLTITSILTWTTTLSSEVNPLSKSLCASSLVEKSDFGHASVVSRFTTMDKSPMRSSKRTEPWEQFSVFFAFTLESITPRIAEAALKTATSINLLWSKNAFRSRTTLSSSVLQGREASIAKSVAHGRRSYSPFLPWPPPFPPQFSSSAGRGGNSDGDSATDGGTSHVFARKPYGRSPN